MHCCFCCGGMQAVMEDREARKAALDSQDGGIRADLHKAKSAGTISSTPNSSSGSGAPSGALTLTGPGAPGGGFAALAAPGLKGLKDSSSSSLMATDDLLAG